MTIQKNITLQVNNSIEKSQPDFSAVAPTQNCDINIQVATGWAITGHYRNQILQTITLHKTPVQEKNHNG